MNDRKILGRNIIIILKHVAKDNDTVERKAVSIMGSDNVNLALDLAFWEAEQEGFEEGFEEALEENIQLLIEVCSEFNLSNEEIAEKVSEKFDIPEDTIKEKYLKDK